MGSTEAYLMQEAEELLLALSHKITSEEDEAQKAPNPKQSSCSVRSKAP